MKKLKRGQFQMIAVEQAAQIAEKGEHAGVNGQITAFVLLLLLKFAMQMEDEIFEEEWRLC